SSFFFLSSSSFFFSDGSFLCLFNNSSFSSLLSSSPHPPRFHIALCIRCIIDLLLRFLLQSYSILHNLPYSFLPIPDSLQLFHLLPSSSVLSSYLVRGWPSSCSVYESPYHPSTVVSLPCDGVVSPLPHSEGAARISSCHHSYLPPLRCRYDASRHASIPSYLQPCWECRRSLRGEPPQQKEESRSKLNHSLSSNCCHRYLSNSS
ncbi:hypothetical protein PMAYCL1PPCAC_12692, partial [Pristionchus mayeri]